MERVTVASRFYYRGTVESAVIFNFGPLSKIHVIKTFTVHCFTDVRVKVARV